MTTDPAAERTSCLGFKCEAENIPTFRQQLYVCPFGAKLRSLGVKCVFEDWLNEARLLTEGRKQTKSGGAER